MSKSIDSIVREFVANYYYSLQDDIDASIKETSKIILDEINKMYRGFIDQFYSYHTTSYIRHGTSKPGTGYGYALYRANRSYLSGSKHPILHIDISGEYIEEDYEYHTADEVLDFVMDDVRFTGSGKKKDGKPWEYSMGWHGQYVGRYFDFDCTILEAFESLHSNWEDYTRYIFDDVIKKYNWR